jgi:hypothetical protein
MSLPPKWFIALYFGNLLIAMVILRLDIPLQLYLVLLAPSIVLVPYFVIKYPNAVTAAGPEMELACDYVALSVIDDKHGAIEALDGLSHGSKLDRKVFDYPSKEDRIKQAVSFIAGIPRVPSKNKFVEDRIGEILQDIAENAELAGISHSNPVAVPPVS